MSKVEVRRCVKHRLILLYNKLPSILLPGSYPFLTSILFSSVLQINYLQ